ncbi:TPA: S-layer homology domain-containing protein [Bacillus cereus]|nr:S-layer homology domain-containing protein [Bacillus cereus]
MLCTGIIISTPFIRANLTIFAEMDQKRSMFSDVSQEHWAHPAIKHLIDQGIIEGYGNSIFGMGDEHGNFRPKDIVTRTEMVQIITKTFQLKTKETSIFDDVSRNYWDFKAIQAVKSNGIALGIGHNQFAPDMKVTREQYAQFLYKTILATQYDSKKILLDNNQDIYVAQRHGNECWFASYLMTVDYINGKKSNYATEKQSLSQTEVMKQYKKFSTSDPFIEGEEQILLYVV